MNTEVKTRDKYIDVVKGIGIISIVIGHASWVIEIAGQSIQIGPFVYLYHLAVFFFCSGYLFKGINNDFWGYVAKKLKSLLLPFIGYTILYLIFRNVFLAMGILDGEKYNLGNYFISITNMITFNGVAEFLGAFWFLPVLFFSLVIYAAIHYLTSFFKNKNIRNILRFLCYLICAAAGIYTTENGFGLLYNIQIAYLMVPVIATGNICGLYRDRIDELLHVWGLIISFILLVVIIHMDIGIIELSKFMIINKFLFYPVTFCGIYFCLCLGKLLCKNKKVEAVFSLVGEMSFDIMALHFLALKLVDYVVCVVTNQRDIMNAFPHSFQNLWFIYYFAGIILPILMKKGYIKMKKYIISKNIWGKWFAIER